MLDRIYGPLTYDHVHGLMLNRTHALALDATSTLRAVRAAFTGAPDPVLLDASSEAGGVDTATRLARAQIEAAADAAAGSWARSAGG